MLKKQFEELRLTGKLPAPTAAGLEILRLTERDDAELDDVSAILHGDATLTRRLLELANSDKGADRIEVTTAHAAVMRLGLKSVRTMSLGFSLLANNRAGRCPSFDYDAFWSFSLAVAAAAQTIAERRGDFPPTDAFTCGLLHGLGRLALASLHPVAYEGVMERARGRPSSRLAEIEQKSFGTNHRELASFMLRAWKVPEHFCAAIAHVGSGVAPEDLRNLTTANAARTLEDALDLARAMTSDIDASPELCRRMNDDLERVRTHLQLDEEGLTDLFTDSTANWRAWGEVMSLRAAPVLSVADIRRRARKSMSTIDVDDLQSTRVAPRSRLKALRILMIGPELSRDVRLRDALVQEGHGVVSVTDGLDGVRKAIETVPHLVLCDWKGTEISGLRIVRALRDCEVGARMHCAIVAPRDKDAHLLEAFEHGADECILRPFDPRILVARARAALKSAQSEERVDDLESECESQAGQLAILTRNLQVAAVTDSLTGVHNRGFAVERLERAFDVARNGTTALSVVSMDVDGFRLVNDVHGRAVGDAVLRATGKLLAGVLRKGDAVCRVGADEFLAICPGANIEGAVEVAERLRVAVRQNVVRVDSFERPSTISLGVAQLGAEHADIDALWTAADRRRDAARAAGGDRIVAEDHAPRLRSAG